MVYRGLIVCVLHAWIEVAQQPLEASIDQILTFPVFAFVDPAAFIEHVLEKDIGLVDREDGERSQANAYHRAQQHRWVTHNSLRTSKAERVQKRKDMARAVGMI